MMKTFLKSVGWVCTVAALLLVGQSIHAQQSSAESQALAKLRAKAEKGDAAAQAQLGEALFLGKRGAAKDEAEAVKWARKAAEQNYAQGQAHLGLCYANGKGVAKDEVEAVKWYRKAAEQNYAAAQTLLGSCYSNGRGVAQDHVEAVKWYRKAAEQNYAMAQVLLGGSYASTGQGVPMDVVEAYKWFSLAAAQGVEEAKKGKAILERRMLPEQIAEGKGLADDWLEQWEKSAQRGPISRNKLTTKLNGRRINL